MSDSEEYVVPDDDFGTPEIVDVYEDNTQVNKVVTVYNGYMWSSPADARGHNHIKFMLPTSFLPLSLQFVYGFFSNPVLLDIDLFLGDTWRDKPSSITIENPVHGKNFVGKVLLVDVVEQFFSEKYRPRSEFRSQAHLLRPSGTVRVSDKEIRTIVHLGFPREKVEDALVLCNSNVDEAITFLKTGKLRNAPPKIPLPEYSECPLLYLALELADVFLDLTDHCCSCRVPLAPGVKPYVCTKPLCSLRLSEMGCLYSVTQEIRRDHQAADLIFSMFATASSGSWLDPHPPDELMLSIPSVIRNLPPMRDLANCANDIELQKVIGKEAMDLLRWVLLSNRSHLITIPEQFRLPQFASAMQFMTFISTPEAERTFENLLGKNKSMFLFHGSHGDRWHSIIRNGLKNATGSSMQANGAALGAGIYFARSSGTSWGYSQARHNGYTHSALGSKLHIISLCEVAPVPALKDHGWAHTLTNESACIVRFLFLGGGFNVDTLSNPPTNIPTLQQILTASVDARLPGGGRTRK